MQILNFFQTLVSKKSSAIFGSLLFFVFTTSCIGKDMSQHGKVKLYDAGGKNFTFSVSEEYLRANQDSKPDKSHPRLTKAEAELLINLLGRRDYCRNDNGKIFFKITSKQEKVYDMTFAHLIEQNYNARPVTPMMYYGECLSKTMNQKEVAKQLIKETKALIR